MTWLDAGRAAACPRRPLGLVVGSTPDNTERSVSYVGVISDPSTGRPR
eukprot:CAMPEP_0119492910 /NCGR_PEP_ID=MMETSP1344-20130328/17315_1 /TAXON_ID=236787 /ORGANISM="Florenciella parvula, Strain CCMP2471" /LENGTH=47 /DNA_ID= /DNA_START= /DNA_END= /DNA_ORIENTATION=